MHKKKRTFLLNCYFNKKKLLLFVNLSKLKNKSSLLSKIKIKAIFISYTFKTG